MSTGRLPAIIFALSVHEAAHAWMALKCGDDTAARMGRITLNPLSHLDPIGALMIAISFIGWGRPVPYVERNLRNPRRDAMLIAAAGPASNVILAAIFGLIFRLALPYAEAREFVATTSLDRVVFFVIFLCSWSVFINLALCFFNLIPIFPLDGEKVLVGLLPYKQANSYASLRQYGPMGLLLLFVVGWNFLGAYITVMGTPLAVLFSGFSMNKMFSIIHVMFSTLW